MFYYLPRRARATTITTYNEGTNPTNKSTHNTGLKTELNVNINLISEIKLSFLRMNKLQKEVHPQEEEHLQTSHWHKVTKYRNNIH